jgi:hypothetical protein
MYFPCAKRYTIFVDDAQKAIHEITLAMQAAYAVRNTNRSANDASGTENSDVIAAPASAIPLNAL